jgi:hypothetical protein
MSMKLISALACVLSTSLLTSANAGAIASNEGHPIEKVISMLKGLKAKAIVDGKNEDVLYQKFAYWCSTSIDTLKDAIADEKEKIDELKDTIAGKTKEKKSLEEEIDALTDQIAESEASGHKAKKKREKENELYEKELADLKGTISAIEAALKTMESAEAATEPGLLQIAKQHVQKALALISLRSSVADDQLDALKAFVDGAGAAPSPAGAPHPDLLAAGDMEAHVDKYDFKSGGVIEMLKKLKLKFQDEKTECVTEETNSVNAYDLAKEAREDAIAAATLSKEKKSKAHADVLTTLANAEGDKANEEEDMTADSKSLADVEEECQTKKNEYEERLKTRQMELDAMDAAVKILSKATGVESEPPENPIPPASPVSFLQTSPGKNSKKMAAVAMLREAAKTTHSRALERLAVEVSSHLSGPFDAVNNMIEKMIFRLMDEQKKEDEHKNWCDEELKKTNVMKTDKEEKIADLSAEIKAQTAAVTELTEDIKAAMEMIAEIDTFMKEATEIREIGKKENKKAIEDATEAQKALEKAIVVLETFYKKDGEIPKEPWEFIQEPVKLPENPKTWDSPYTAVADPTAQPAGIITVLENVMTDFAKMEAETKSSEAVDQEEYEQSMKDNKIEKARRTQEAEMKSTEKERRIEKITSLTSKKKDVAAELEKTEQYLKDLEPACVTGDSTYEARKSARSQEIKALQKAQITLDDAFKEDPEEKTETGFLQVRRHIQ